MSLLADLGEFYSSWLNDAGFKLSDDGTHQLMSFRRTKDGASYRNCRLDGKPLCLVTKSNLDLPDTENMLYHPLTEDSLKGESATIKLTKNQINYMLTMRYISLLSGIATALVDGDSRKLSPKLRALFNKNPDFNSAISMKWLMKLIGKVKQSKVNRHLISIYLHTKTKYNDKACRRVAVVSSSLYNDLMEENKVVWGLEVPPKHQKIIAQLLVSVLPGIADDSYTVSSKSKIAPYFETLAESFMNVSERLDYVTSITKSQFEDKLPYPKAEYKWVDGLDELGKLQIAAPVLLGNAGNDEVGAADFDVDINRNVSINESKPKPKSSANPDLPAPSKSVQREEVKPHPYLNTGSNTPTHPPVQPQGYPQTSPQLGNPQGTNPYINTNPAPHQGGYPQQGGSGGHKF